MNGYRQDSVNLLPPQIFELSRLANFRKLDDLIEFLVQRDHDDEYRTERLLGVCYKLSDATVLVMPDDDHYPSDASFTTPVLSSDKALHDFDSDRQNRLVMMNKGTDRKWQVHFKNSNSNQKNDLRVYPLENGWEKS